MNDLVHVGIMGLLEALQRYRPGTVKVKTFAEYRIKGAMLDELRSQDWLPRSLKDKVAQIRTAERELELNSVVNRRRRRSRRART